MDWLLLVASRAGAVVFLFYALWGFNYGRIGLDKQLRLEPAPLDAAALRAEAEWTVRSLAETRASLPDPASASLVKGSLPSGLEVMLRTSLSAILKSNGYPAPGRVRVRPLWPGGLMLRLSSSGFYCPFCGEGYIASNLTPSEVPFSAAHEMAHAFGITDEGDANLLGFVACESSGVPAVRYSGFLAYWEYLFPELSRTSAGDARKFSARLPDGARADLRAAYENWQRYRGPLRVVAGAVYDRYLKSQGIVEGARSYDRFVMLVTAWKRRGS